VEAQNRVLRHTVCGRASWSSFGLVPGGRRLGGSVSGALAQGARQRAAQATAQTNTITYELASLPAVSSAGRLSLASWLACGGRPCELTIR